MKPKKEQIERFTKNGSFARVNNLLSTAQLLIGVANNYAEEAYEILTNNGLVMGEMKPRFAQYVRAADRYFEEFGQMITTEKMVMFQDMEKVDQMIREFAKLEKEWEPKEEE